MVARIRLKIKRLPTNSTEGNRTEMRYLKAAYFDLIFVFFDTILTPAKSKTYRQYFSVAILTKSGQRAHRFIGKITVF